MKALALAPALLLASPAAAQAGQPAYRALGTEPFWSLTIDARTIRYVPATGRPISVARPRATAAVNGKSYRTARMTVDILHRRCSDGMSDRTYADTVRVRIGGLQLSGCGGGIVGEDAATPLAGRWRIDLLNGRPLRFREPATLRFDGGRLSGRICNGFGGAYRFARGTLTTREIVATQMACGEGRTEAENAVFAALRRPLKVHRGGGGDTLVLSDGRSSITLRRAE